jgi:hypothetical protein
MEKFMIRNLVEVVHVITNACEVTGSLKNIRKPKLDFSYCDLLAGK